MPNLLISTSPADPGDEIGRYAIAGPPDIDAAVDRARRAFPAWRDLGLDARAGILRRFAALAAERAPELAALIAREVGKAPWDARGEAALLAPKVVILTRLSSEARMRWGLVLDGAMGTMVQSYNLNEKDFRCDRFKNHGNDLKGNNDILCLTQPAIVQEIHGA